MAKIKVTPTETLPATRPLGDVERGEAAMLAREMAKAHASYVAYLAREYKLTREEAIQRAQGEPRSEEETLSRLENESPDQLSWMTFNDAVEIDPVSALARWDKMKEEAREELESGMRGADALRLSTPWDRARYAAVRQGFVEEWRPRGGLERSLVEQMAQAYTAWLLWLRHFEALAGADLEWREEQVQQAGRYRSQSEHRAWQEDRVLQTADRFQRVFLRTLRALRDLRRYSPQITIHNRGQVNIGEQQVNVADREKRTS